MKCILQAAAITFTTLTIPVTGISAQQVAVSQRNRIVTVNATGKASELADRATVHIGFVVYGPEKDAAYSAGSAASNTIVEALTKAGVPSDAIESEMQTLSEGASNCRPDLTPEQVKERAFQVQQSWVVHVPAKDASAVLQVAIQAGANMSGQIDWSLEDMGALHVKAQQDAMEQAHKESETIARGMGVRLGALLQASDQMGWDGGNGGLAGGRIGAVLGGAYSPNISTAVPLAIRAKKVEDSATIYAVYAIE